MLLPENGPTNTGAAVGVTDPVMPVAPVDPVEPVRPVSP
jgi:hypothetical protein